ncbi:OB-fold nucleic acid binding domain-containing protein [Candidatus Pacearchaeota archaeon]|nr:OB-fold nucleic acid binding domain-containing protein [Candidatus Pacearchaeota archaeon]
MKETTLLKTALICSLLGLVILYFISAKIDVKDYNAGILNKNIGDDVKLTGKITKISQSENVAFLEVSYESPITIVLFTDKNVSLEANDSIEIIGEVQEYKGKNEIIAQKVRVVR